MIRTAILLAVSCMLSACTASHRADRPFEGEYAHGAVACDHPVASAAGAEMLAAGGNAVDAAVAASFTLSVVRPYSCGIGGGGFMLIHLNDDPRHGTVNIAINYRETCPSRVNAETFTQHPDPEASLYGGAAVAVPSTVAGLLHALDRYGTMDRREVLAPAIRAAREGFAVDEHYARAAASLARQFEAKPEWKDRFEFVWLRFLQEGQVRIGDTIVLPEQALTLTRIAHNGLAGFISGETADAIVSAVGAAGGGLSRADLEAYRPVEVTPIEASIAGLRFLGMPPPSSGGVAMFQTLKTLDLLGHPPTRAVRTPTEAHLLAEALQHAFADRARWMADPAFVPVPTEAMLGDAAAAHAAALIRRDATLGDAEAYGQRWGGDGLAGAAEDAGTSHLSVVDARGNAVSCTETINTEWGSLVCAGGFALNNQMDDFTTRPGEANFYGLRQSDRNLPAPGKRPLSSMSPTIVLDDRGVVAVAGASGGPRIITGTLQSLLNALSGMDAGDAVAAPRIHHQWLPNRLELEPGALAGPGQRAALESRGHTLSEREHIGNVQLIRRTSGGWQAACDPRKGGRPAGL